MLISGYVWILFNNQLVCWDQWQLQSTRWLKRHRPAPCPSAWGRPCLARPCKNTYIYSFILNHLYSFLFFHVCDFFPAVISYYAISSSLSPCLVKYSMLTHLFFIYLQIWKQEQISVSFKSSSELFCLSFTQIGSGTEVSSLKAITWILLQFKYTILLYYHICITNVMMY